MNEPIRSNPVRSLAAASMLAGALCSLVSCSDRSPAATPLSYAVFAEHSPESKPIQPGWNQRIFTKTEALAGDEIRLHEETGTITLAPGTYHLTGFSTTVYFTAEDPPEMVPNRSPANGGYCRLRPVAAPGTPKEASPFHGGNETAIVVGSVSTSNAVPSLFEAYFTTEVEMHFALEHQSGSNVQDVYLRVYTQKSPWHVFARLAIRRI